jgi:hypothetical protein
MMPVLAHYGGIDEIGVFVVPALIAIWALRKAERRARRQAEEREAEGKEMALDNQDDG